jgi:NADH:ubiquinone oxidoreductase subunit E
MPTPDPTPAGEGEAVATADSPWAFSPEREERFQEIVRRYPTNFSAIMPTLWLCQE